jgi:hypothetical protein
VRIRGGQHSRPVTAGKETPSGLSADRLQVLPQGPAALPVLASAITTTPPAAPGDLWVMSRRIGHVTLCSRSRIGFLIYPGAPRLQLTHLDVALSGAAMGVVPAERLTTSPDSWEFLLIELGAAADHKLCLNYAYRTRRNLNDLVRVGPVGLEPTTYGLKVRSSAN